jgi:hemerythrin superfamily protein
MVATLDDTKRQAIGTALATIKALQELLISNEQQFLQECNDDQIRQRFQDMLNDDQKNIGVLDTVIVQYGVKGEPDEQAVKLVEKSKELMQSSNLSFFKKVSQHELLKHNVVMKGLLLHKAAQVVGADIQAAIAPLNTINFENRAHQEQLKGVLEVLGVRELTGQEPDQGLWARVQDAVAALTGVAGSVITRSDDEISIRDLIRMDHAKVNTLFTEIMGCNDAQKIEEFYGQLHKDLSVHADAEEQVVYPAVRSYYEKTQELYDEQAEMKQLLKQIKSLSPSASDFKSRIEQLMKAVQSHVNQEEGEMFPKIRDNFNNEQQKQMATEFKKVKSQLQDQLAAASK